MNRRIWLVLFLILVFGFTFYDGLRYYFSDKMSVLRLGKRLWRQVEVRREFVIFHNLFIPGVVECDKFGDIYVLDYGDVSVKKFSASGKFIIKFGIGRGQGPGELLNPTDIKIDDRLNLWICDAGNVKVSVFDNRGKLYKEFKLSAVPLRVSPLQDGGFIVQEMMEFKRYDANGRGVFGFKDDFIFKRFDNPLYWSSFLISDSAFLYCVLYDLGYLICINLGDGSVKYRVKVMDAPPPPEIVVREFRGAKVAKLVRKSNSLTVGFNVLDDMIFLHTVEVDKKDDFTVIDVYSSVDGRYLYSFKIPGKFRRGYFDGRYYYGVGDTIVSKFEVLFR